MVSKVTSVAVLGLDVVKVTVEVDISNGLPGLSIVGLPDKSVDESRERVRSAIKASGAALPAKRIVVNLAPAHIRKEGSAYDVPIAIGILAAAEQIPPLPPGYLCMGELSLGGEFKSVRGVLAAVIEARALGAEEIYVPYDNVAEAAVVDKLKVYGVRTLQQLIDHFKQERPIAAYAGATQQAKATAPLVDLADIRGQQMAKRALELAAAGGHNLLLSGPPGTGKTLLARAMAGILPKLSGEEVLEVTKIYSISGALRSNQPLITQRPFRSPHHSISLPGLIGGGSWPRPGEVSLAHHGVLFLDEVTQFPRHVLEALRGPLEDRVVRISRAQHVMTFPTDCMLLASENPCPCGYASDPTQLCQCSPLSIERYRGKLSGPIRDRFDMNVEVPRLPYETLKESGSESSDAVRQRVEAARERQRSRFGCDQTNASMSLKEVERYCKINDDAESLLVTAVNRWHLSVRAYHRVLKVARTISDMGDMEKLGEDAVLEALRYRHIPAMSVA